jgi:hypothetical protein
MAHLLNEELDRRLRATAPPLAPVDEDLLARLMTEPPRGRRRPRRARLIAPLGVATAVAAVAFALLASGPGTDNASAIEQAMRWFDPPNGQMLHTRIVDAQGAQEFWGSARDMEHARFRYERGDTVYEMVGPAIWDAARNTIYEPGGGGKEIDLA